MSAIVALTAGILFSSYLAVVRLRQAMIVTYHAPFRFWRPYLRLYDGLENGYNYELLGGEKRFGSRSAYHGEFQKLRPGVTHQFCELWDKYALGIIRSYGLALAISLVLFWGVWWVFLLSFMALQLCAFMYLYFRKKYHAHYFASLMLSLLFERSRVVKTTDDFIKRSE